MLVEKMVVPTVGTKLLKSKVRGDSLPLSEKKRSSVVVTEVDNLECLERGGRWQTNPRAYELFVAELADEVEVCEAVAAVVGWQRCTFSTVRLTTS